MMKRFFCLALIALLSLPVWGISQSSDFTIIDGTLNAYNGSDSDVVIPDGVTTIASNAFYGKPINTVSLPSSLRTIQAYAFKESRLKRIEIPAGVETIGIQAFGFCDQLETVTFHSKSDDIHFAAFSGTTHKFDVYAYFNTAAWNTQQDAPNAAYHSLDNHTVSFELDSDTLFLSVYQPKKSKTTLKSVTFFPEIYYDWAMSGVTFESSNPEIVSFVYDKYGPHFVGHKEGSAVITARYGDASFTKTVKVLDAEPAVLKYNKITINLAENGARMPEMSLLIHPEYRYHESSMQVSWYSTNREVITSKPLIQEFNIVGTGVAEIGAVFDDMEQKCTVEVINAPDKTGIKGETIMGGAYGVQNGFDGIDPIETPVLELPSSSKEYVFSFEEMDITHHGKNGTITYNIHLKDKLGNPTELPDASYLTFPYPDGLNQDSIRKYRIIIHHYGTKNTEVFKSENGDIEFLPQGLRIRVSDFSPFMIEWGEPVDAATLPATGDTSGVLLWSVLAFISLFSMMALKKTNA